jgi:integrase
MMARSFNKLSDTYLRSGTLKVGRHSDGGGLYLNVSPSGTKSWLFMWVVAGKRREMGLGPYPAISLAKARNRASTCRTQLEDGLDPIAERDREAEPTFGKCADLFLESMEASWRNDKHRAQWRMTLDIYCEPIRGKRVSSIDTEDVLKVLKPLWSTKPETASRLRGRIERVLDFAAARGWRNSENPARWRGHLKSVLPARVVLSRGHHAAMPYDDVPAFVAKLRNAAAMAARALEFLILTAARSGEALGATWAEIDLGARAWTIPALRMKAAREHRVPLSDRAVAILTQLAEARVSEFVFPGQKPGRPLSATAMEMLLRRMKADQYTVHGFRSAFRDWAGDETQFQREVAEAALAHRVGDATERAYRRADALEKRRELMKAWERFCQGGGPVVNLRSYRSRANVGEAS